MVKKKLAIILGSVAGAILIPSGVVLAKFGVDDLEAFLATQEAMLDGLVAYFNALIDLFKLVL